MKRNGTKRTEESEWKHKHRWNSRTMERYCDNVTGKRGTCKWSAHTYMLNYYMHVRHQMWILCFKWAAYLKFNVDFFFIVHNIRKTQCPKPSTLLYQAVSCEKVLARAHCVYYTFQIVCPLLSNLSTFLYHIMILKMIGNSLSINFFSSFTLLVLCKQMQSLNYTYCCNNNTLEQHWENCMENKNNQMQFVAAISQCDKSDFHRFWSKMHFMEFRSKKNIERKGNAANEDEKCVQITNEMQQNKYNYCRDRKFLSISFHFIYSVWCSVFQH